MCPLAWIGLTYAYIVSDFEQIIFRSSNRRMKQLMDWLSNPH